MREQRAGVEVGCVNPARSASAMPVRPELMITGPSYEYIVFDNATTLQSTLTYPAATLDKSKATLTVRTSPSGPRTTIDRASVVRPSF